MIYLVGVNHEVQYDRDSEQTTKFITYLRGQIKELKISFIAEEWSDSASHLWKVKTSTVADLARELKIEYKPCDPNLELRAQLGIGKGEEHYPARELFWYQQIRDKTSQNMMFICGAKHLSVFHPPVRFQRFDELLAHNRCEVRILLERFDESPAQESGLD